MCKKNCNFAADFVKTIKNGKFSETDSSQRGLFKVV